MIRLSGAVGEDRSVVDNGSPGSDSCINVVKFDRGVAAEERQILRLEANGAVV